MNRSQRTRYKFRKWNADYRYARYATSIRSNLWSKRATPWTENESSRYRKFPTFSRLIFCKLENGKRRIKNCKSYGKVKNYLKDICFCHFGRSSVLDSVFLFFLIRKDNWYHGNKKPPLKLDKVTKITIISSIFLYFSSISWLL